MANLTENSLIEHRFKELCQSILDDGTENLAHAKNAHEYFAAQGRFFGSMLTLQKAYFALLPSDQKELLHGTFDQAFADMQSIAKHHSERILGTPATITKETTDDR